MFRRQETKDVREDGLFDTDTLESSASEATSFGAPQAAAPKDSTTVHVATATANNAAAATAQPARPTTEVRASAPTANAFRANATTMSSDLTRNRLPEAKNATTTASTGNADKNNKSSARRVLTVGHDILLKGEIATCDRLVIEGKVDATLNDVHTVEIAENGSFKGSAHIEDAEISGLFEGDLTVRNILVIRATGRVRGKITYGSIEIERGGELTGEIKCGSSATATSARPASRSSIKEDDKVAA